MSKATYAILVFLFNGYGITSFLNGNNKKGIYTIISAFITLGVVGIINGIKGILLALKIFKMTDEEYAAADKATLEDAIVLLYKD
ncbi:MAG: hypothetical protein J6V66_05295 [Clostridia bacterium]|nr:hypothetical protein [Clostridia bacterium]